MKCKIWVVGVTANPQTQLPQGGDKTLATGYVRLYMPNHPRATNSGQVKRAIINLEKKLGHPIPSGFVGQHLNGIKTDDAPNNLIAISKHEHDALHARMTMGNGNIFTGRKGEAHPLAKLKDREVKAIKIALNNGDNPKELSRKYCVSENTINHIKRGYRWKHITI